MENLKQPSDVTHNLTAVVEVLQKFDDKAHQIGMEGQSLTEHILTPENVQEYWMRLLTAYSKLMKFKPQVHADAITIGKSLTSTVPSSFKLTNRTCAVCDHYASAGNRWEQD